MMSIFGLLARFMRETYNVDDAHHVKQAHFAKLSDFFDELPKSYGKSPSDKLKSIVQLQEKGQEVSHEKRGLDPGTRNRHLTYLGQWLNEATARGASNCRDIKLTSFRSRRKGRPRDDRPAPGLEAITRFFQGPPFVGCLDRDSPCERGSEVFHRATYFAPMMTTYMGMRREEACGLGVDDVKFTDGIANVDIKFSAIRRIKNASSVRFLAVHPDLLRLDLMDYVDAIREMGYTTLFSDLRGSGSNVPLGDRLYDELRPLIDETGAGFHPQRHFLEAGSKPKGSALKNAGISWDMLADLKRTSGIVLELNLNANWN